MAESDERMVRWACPGCGTALRAKAAMSGGRMPCPRCGEAVDVPSESASEPASPGESADVSTGSTSAGQSAGRVVGGVFPADEFAVRDMYGVLDPKEHSGPVVPVTPPDGEMDDDEPLIETRSGKTRFAGREISCSRRPELPPRPMFQGVLDCFLGPGLLARWAVLSGVIAIMFGLLLMTEVLAAAGILVTGGWLLKILFLLIPGFFVGLFWAVTASAFGLAVLQDSAAGNRRIENWPDVVWLDWVTDAAYILAAVLTPLAVAKGLGYVLEGDFWFRADVCCFFLFPVVLLSTLDAQSPFVPLTTNVLRSMVRCWRTWLIFYSQTYLLRVVTFGLMRGVGELGDWLGGSVAAFLFVPVVALSWSVVPVGAGILYFRLLGRLAWVCDETARLAAEAEEEAQREAEEAAEAEGDQPEVRETPVDDF